MNAKACVSEHRDLVSDSRLTASQEGFSQPIETTFTDSISRVRLFALAGLLLSLAALCYAWSLPSRFGAPVASVVSSASVPTAIADVQLGWRVVGENPLGKETWDEEPDELTWRKVILNLRSEDGALIEICLLYTSPSPRDRQKSRMPSSA